MDRSKEYLKKEIEKEVTSLFEAALDYAQVACAHKDTFKALRSKILRVGNDCIRNLNSELDKNYDVKFKPDTEDLIKVGCK